MVHNSHTATQQNFNSTASEKQSKINTPGYCSKESCRHPISKETECLVNQCQIRHITASHEGTREKLRET